MTDAHLAPDVAVPTKFSALGTPLLSAGSTMTLLANAPSLWLHLKVYAEGGENNLHAHTAEDHIFYVLDGEATFVDGAAGATVVGRNEGMVVPRGTLYSFSSSGEGNLVMLRVGAPIDPDRANWSVDEQTGAARPGAMLERVDSAHRPAPGDARANGTGAMRGVPIPGLTFS